MGLSEFHGHRSISTVSERLRVLVSPPTASMRPSGSQFTVNPYLATFIGVDSSHLSYGKKHVMPTWKNPYQINEQRLCVITQISVQWSELSYIQVFEYIDRFNFWIDTRGTSDEKAVKGPCLGAVGKEAFTLLRTLVYCYCYSCYIPRLGLQTLSSSRP